MKRNVFRSMPILPGGSVGLAVFLLAVGVALLLWALNHSPYDPALRTLLLLSTFGFLGATVCALWAVLRPLRPPRGLLAKRAAWGALVAGGLGFSCLYCGLSQGVDHVSRNESRAIGDIRTVISAQSTYRSVNWGAFEGELSCLARPRACLPGYPAESPDFLGEDLASLALRGGYERSFHPGLPAEEIRPDGSPTSVRTWAYVATPIAPGYSGIRSFCGDSTEQICSMADGGVPPLREDGTCDLERCELLS